ncbi:MAG: DNA double-strand break repair nuclease NurA [Methanosarcinaceae archaeon]|nr:DNA double-strand break repair nuclease NurA [Methanosarcinaceae archaeon]
MPLEQVHIKAILDITSNIELYLSDESNNKELPNILKYLQELKHNDKTILKSIGSVNLFEINKFKMSQSKDVVKSTYSCDSGSTNPILFDNGLFVSFCHAVIATIPTNLEIHKKRTIVSVAYSESKSTRIRTNTEWNFFDDDTSRWKLIQIESGLLKKGIDRVVHDIALYFAESEHILLNIFNLNGFKNISDLKNIKELENLNEDEFFIMDGPIIPKQLIYLMALKNESIRIYEDEVAEKIIQNYIDIIDYHIKRKIPIIGFVKNPEDSYILKALKSKEYELDLPWTRDSQLFKAILSNHTKDSENLRFSKNFISYTNWFIHPYKSTIEKASPITEFSMPDEDYFIAFFIIYVPDMDVVFKIESPYGLIKNEKIRNHITKKVLYDISLNGIPITLTKADSIAKIRISEKQQIIDRFKNIKSDTIYNDIRWGNIDE